MALTITHGYVSTVAEAPGSGVPGGRVGPNEWNAAHVLTGTIDPSNIGAGGNPGSVQFNNAGAIGGATNTLWNDTNQLLTFGGFSNTQIAATPSRIQTIENANVGGGNWAFSSIAIAANSSGVGMAFAKTRGANPTSQTALSSGDGLFALDCYGSDGVNYQSATSINFEADAAFSAGSSPSRIRFSTTRPGATNVTESLRIDSSQRLLINTTTDFGAIVGVNSQVVIGSTTNFAFTAGQFSNDNNGLGFNFLKSRSATIGNQAILQTNDHIAQINFTGSDGSSWTRGGFIQGVVDAAPSVGHMPGRLIFYTSSASVQDLEAMRIDSNQYVTIGGFANTQIAATPSSLQVVLNNSWALSLMTIGNHAFGAAMATAKTRGSTPTTQVAVVNNDEIYALRVYASDGAAFQAATSILSQADATFTAGSSPGRIILATTRTATTSTVEAMRIDSAQNVAVCSGGGGVIPTNSINGFFYINTMAGNPSGVPAPPNALTGLVPMIYDTTNNRLWVRNAGTWRSVLLS